MAHDSLIRSTFHCNMNHIIRIIEFFLLKDEDLALDYILSMNMPFIFINYLDFQLAQQMLLNLFNCSESSHLSEANQNKVYQYAHRSRIFIDLAKLIFLAEQSVDPRKTSLDYNGLGAFSHFQPMSQRGRMDYSTHGDTDFDFAHNVFPELKQNFQTDIDRIKSYYYASLDSNRKSTLLRRSISKKSSIRTEESKIQEPQRDNEASAKPKFMGYEYDKLPKSKIDKLIKYPSLKIRWDTFQKELEAFEAVENKNSEEPKRKVVRIGTKKVTSNQFRIKGSRSPTKIVTIDSDFTEKSILPQKLASRELRGSRGLSSIGEIDMNPSFSNKTLSLEETQELKSRYASQRSSVNVSPLLRNTVDQKSLPKLERMKKETRRTNSFKFEEPQNLGPASGFMGLYPMESKNFVKTEVDKEADGPIFQSSKLQGNDQLSLIGCEVLHIIIRRMIENDQNKKMKMLLKKSACDYRKLWQAILGIDQCVFFEYLLKVTWNI